MKCYIVGGWVRDYLRGQPSHDKDWVIVGGTKEEVIAAGFIPLDASFPVFLHPHTKEEYALARTERKVGKGYRGFEAYSHPDVSLTEDLARRDLTINAMAFDPETQQLIDPFGGQKDWAEHKLRHVSDAFADDPLRLIRLARFYASFPQTYIDPETLILCKEIVKKKELLYIARERIRLELEKTYARASVPLRFWQALHAMTAENDLFPFLDISFLNTACVQDCTHNSQPFLKGLFDLRKYFSIENLKNFHEMFRFSQEEKKIWSIAQDLSSLDSSLENLLDFSLRHRLLQNHPSLYQGYLLAVDPVWSWDFLMGVQEKLKAIDFSALNSSALINKKEILRDYYRNALRGVL